MNLDHTDANESKKKREIKAEQKKDGVKRKPWTCPFPCCEMKNG